MHDDDLNADLRTPAQGHHELVEQVATLAFQDTDTEKAARVAAVWILNQVLMALRQEIVSYVVSQGTPTQRTVRTVPMDAVERLLKPPEETATVSGSAGVQPEKKSRGR